MADQDFDEKFGDIELDDYEREIEENIDKFKPVENFDYWKKLLQKAAENTLRKRKKEKSKGENDMH